MTLGTLGPFCLGMPTIPDRIELILAPGPPSQIFDPIVGRVVVPVKTFRTREWSRPIEGFQHEMMHFGTAPWHANSPMSRQGMRELSKYPPAKPSGLALSGDDPINASDLSLPGGLVSGTPRDLSPHQTAFTFVGCPSLRCQRPAWSRWCQSSAAFIPGSVRLVLVPSASGVGPGEVRS